MRRLYWKRKKIGGHRTRLDKDFLSLETILAGFITIGIYLSWRIISKLCVFNTAYIGLFDKSLLHMSLNQVELALKNVTSKSRTPVSIYQFDPILNSIWQIILKTFHVQIFFVTCRKKSGGHRASNKNIRRSSYRKGHQLYILLSFYSVRPLENDVAP